MQKNLKYARVVEVKTPDENYIGLEIYPDVLASAGFMINEILEIEIDKDTRTLNLTPTGIISQ